MKMIDDTTLAMVAKFTSQVVIVTDAARKVTWANSAFTSATGYAPEEIIGRSPGSLLQGHGSCPETIRRIRSALDSGLSCQEEILNFRKDGSPYWIVLNIEPIFSESGELRGYIGVNQDITPQKNLEIELVQRQDQLRKLADERQAELNQSRKLIDTIVQNSPMGIVITDRNDTIQLFNPAAEKALGYRAEEVVGKHTPAILHDSAEYFEKLRTLGWDGEDFSPEEFSKVREIFMQHFPLVDEWTYRRKDGSSFPALLALTGLRDENEQILGFTGMFADISQQREAENELRLQNRLRSLLSETASKFINLPLDEVESAIENALGELGSFLDVDRAYVFKNSPDNITMSNTHEWCAPGIFPVKDELQNLFIADFPEWEQFLTGEHPLLLPDVPAMPPGVLKEVLTMQDIKSMVAVPMMLRGKSIGFVGFDSVRNHRTYTQDEQSLLAHFSRMLVNIRMRQESQEALLYSEQRLQNVIDSAGEFVWETDADGNLIYLSSRAELVFCMDIGDLLGRRWQDFCTEPENKESITREVELHLRNGSSFQNLGLVTQSSRGLPVHLLLNGRRSNRQGAKPGLIGLTLDITKEFLTRQELEQTRGELERFFEMSLDLVCIVDREGRFVKVNRPWEDLLEKKACNIEGTPCIDHVHPDDVGATLLEFQKLYDGCTVGGFVNRYRSSKGGYRMIEWFGKLEGAHIYASARDVTEREQTRLALQHALEEEKKASILKANLISMASHEFRTPLASIRIAAELIHRYANQMQPEQMQKSVSTIMERTDYMTEIINDVLDLQLIGVDGQEKQESDVRLVEFLEEIVSSFRKLEHGRHQLSFISPKEEILMHTLPNLLQRIVGNLLQNALKYSPHNSPVEIECRLADSDTVEILVSDCGIGVPEEQVPLLFEPFFRASNTGSTKGSGLGLSICQSAMQRLGGTILYKPNSPQGSIFEVILPLGRAHAKHREKTNPANP